MDGHIDWLSFTLKDETEPRRPMQVYFVAKSLLERISQDVSEIYFSGNDLKQEAGRAPYRYCVLSRDTGLRVYGGSHTKTILVEISGKGCDAIRGSEVSQRVVRDLGDRITRIDYAVDIRTRTLPVDFTRERNPNHFRSKSVIRSDKGETVYIGSPSSDRFARIYRYNPPHPRHELLRVEFVFRRGLAKSASEYYTNTVNLEGFIRRLGNTYGLKHPDWQPTSQTDERLKTPERRKTESKTVSWLYSQVAPALARCIQEDAINVADFLEHVYSL